MAKRRKTLITDSGSAIPQDDDNFSPVPSASDTSDYEEYSLPKRKFAEKTTGKSTRIRNRKKEVHPGTSHSHELTDIWRHPSSIHIISESQIKPVREAVRRWYETVKDRRGMPWRKSFDPHATSEQSSQRAYEVWVSEVMLQQTQVATVIPYYNRWMEKFPTIRDLASSSIDDVNALWKGLGYYTRASRLLFGAQKVMNEYGGIFPDNAKSMQADIPGIGRYSAGAICSIAYGEHVPVLDGNVHRLLSRFLALYASPKAKSTLDVLWDAAAAFVNHSAGEKEVELCVARTNIDSTDKNPHQKASITLVQSEFSSFNPGDINQALIELGSTVCKAQEPACALCPLSAWCQTYPSIQRWQRSDNANETVDMEDLCTLCEPLSLGSGPSSFPMKSARKKAREEVDIVGVVEWLSTGSLLRQRQFLLVKRPSTGLLAGLHEFPTLPDVDPSLSDKEVEKLIQDFLEISLGAQSNVTDMGSVTFKYQSVGKVKHVFSHIKKIYRVLWVIIQSEGMPPSLGHDRGTEIAHSPPHKKRKAGQVEYPDKEPVNGRWLSLEDVENANIGKGMAKVWALTQKLWER